MKTQGQSLVTLYLPVSSIFSIVYVLSFCQGITLSMFSFLLITCVVSFDFLCLGIFTELFFLDIDGPG